MAFRHETELLGPVTGWLEAAGFDVHAEVPILGRRADLVGSRGDLVAAVELKLTDWRGAFRQALSYQLGADYAWVALPLAVAGRAYRNRWKFEAEKIGLFAVDDGGRVRVPVPAVASPRLLPFVRARIIESLERPSLDLVAAGTDGRSAIEGRASRELVLSPRLTN